MPGAEREAPVLGLGWKVGRFQYYDPVVQPLYVPLVRKFKKRVEGLPPHPPLPGPDPSIEELVLEPAAATPGDVAVAALDSSFVDEKVSKPPGDKAALTHGAGDRSNSSHIPGLMNQVAKGIRKNRAGPKAPVAASRKGGEVKQA